MKKTRHSLLFNIIVVLFVFFCAMTIIKLQIEINAQGARNNAQRQENEEIRYEIDGYKDDLAAPKDQDYYEKKAREKLNLRLPEEIIFYNDLIN